MKHRKRSSLLLHIVKKLEGPLTSLKIHFLKIEEKIDSMQVN